jgi:mannose-1-phosphate guanylyltransferase/phosphomannomutase
VPVARYFTRVSSAAGGIHVRLSPYDSRVVEVKFFDEQGLDITTTAERKVENTYFREDFRRAYLDEIGRIAYGDEVEQTYRDAFVGALRTEALAAIGRSFQLVVDYANTSASAVLSPLLRRFRVDAVELNVNLDEEMVFQTMAQFEAAMARLSQITPVVGANMGARLDSSGERLFVVDDTGARLSSLQTLAAMTALVMRAGGGGAVAVPVTAPLAFETIARRYGGQIVRTRATFGALMQTASQRPDLLLLGDGTGAYIFPSFYPIADGMFALLKLMELLTLTESQLSAVIADLPPYHMAQNRVPCRWESKGKVMRLLNEQYAERAANHIDGIKIELGSEWVLILPDPDGPFFNVIAEGHNDEQARVLVEKYTGLVTSLQ